MKRRVGKYKNKIIVEGDKNEFKPHEVSIKELAGTDNMGGGVDDFYPTIYYKFLRNDIPELKAVSMYGGLVKGVMFNANHKDITPVGIISLDAYEVVEAFSFNPFMSELNGVFQPLNSIEEFCALMMESSDVDEEMVNLILNNITRITKEEFYNISG